MNSSRRTQQSNSNDKVGGLRDDIVAELPTLSAKLNQIGIFAAQSPHEFVRLKSREICDRVGSSEPTLIRFCRLFGYSGVAEFRIALALDLSARGAAPSVGVRRTANTEGKRRMAAEAVRLLAGESSFLIDNGSSAEFFASALSQAGRFVVMTSSLAVAQTLTARGRHQVMLTGGLIDSEGSFLTGRMVEASLKGMCFDCFVMGADSLDPGNGPSTWSESEAHITRAMMHAADRTIVLADQSKFRRSSLHWICGFESVDAVITDVDPAPEVFERIAAAGTKVVVAHPDATRAND